MCFLNEVNMMISVTVFLAISNRPVNIVDLLGKGLNDNQVFKAVLTFLELTGLDHRI